MRTFCSYSKCYNALLLPLILALTACATSPNTSSTLVKRSNVPALQVKLDCGTCVVRENIQQLIKDGYNNAAKDAGVGVTQDKTIHLTIKEYVERSDVARFLVGALAGKDEIKASVTYDGSSYLIEDYYMNAWLGIESLATKIGEMTFSKIKS